MHGDQRLVRGDHVLAVLDSLEHQFTGHGVATDQFDDDIDLGVAGNVEHVRGNGGTGNLAVRVGRTHGNLCHFNTTPGTAGDLLGVTLKYIEGTATDGPQPTDAYFDRFHCELPIERTTRSRP
ncbi:hypothetical protein D9M73_198750 [compost metagenome]